MVFRNSRKKAAQRSPKQIWADWLAANEAGDATRAGECAAEMVAAVPGAYSSWFEAGLHAKARREWKQSAEWNTRALDLFGAAESKEFEGANPAAWNLGIAATVLGDWDSARLAWTTYGIEGLTEDSGPIDANYGMAPIRLNPDRPSLALEIPADYGTTEVVWCWRRSPAHAVIASVPLPESGHRFRDVLVHDGEPKGTRRDGDREVSVFDEITKLTDSGIPTWQAQIVGAKDADVAAAGDVFGERGLGADNWSGINLMCSDCSHGSPDDNHHHDRLAEGTTLLGLAGHEDEVAQALQAWQSTRPDVGLVALELLW